MAQAYVLLNCKINQIEKELENIPEIEEVEQVCGAHDYVLKTKDMPKNKLQKFITNKISRSRFADSTLTLETKTE